MKRFIVPVFILLSCMSTVASIYGQTNNLDSTTAMPSLAATTVPGQKVTAAPEKPVAKPMNDDVNELLFFQEINITVSSKKEESILKTVSTVSVIDQYLIKKYNFQTVGEAVQTLAGVDITRSTMMQGTVMTRGIWQGQYPNKILIMINNVPAYLATTGEGFVNRVGINDVERIEVLKGPASVLYGSNAYVGAVNIVLKEAKTEGEFSQAWGSFGEKKYFSAGANSQYKKGDFTISTFANASDQEGTLTTFTDDRGVTGNFYNMRYPSGGNGSLLARYQGHSFLFSGYKDRLSIFEGADPNYNGGGGRTQGRYGYLCNYGFNDDWELADLNASATFDWNGRIYPRTLDDATRTQVEGYRIAGVVDTNIKVLNPFVLELGYTYDYRKSDLIKSFLFPSDTIIDDMNLSYRNVNENSIITQFKYELDNFNVVLGGRLTNNELFGFDFSPRLTTVYLLDRNNSLKLIAGKSFRAPSLFELYVRNTSRTLSGNTDLDPETAKSLELAYLFSYEKLFCQVQVYRVLYEGLIGRVTYPSYTFPDETFARTNVRVYQNCSAFNAWGSELEVSYRDPKLLSGFFTAAYVSSDDPGNDLNFKYIPDMIFNLGLSKDIGDFFASANAIYRTQMIGNLGQNIVGNAEANLNLGYTLSGGKIVHMLSVKNVADVESLIPAIGVRNVNELPSGNRREVLYTFSMSF